jgi:hypothetical protein
VDAELIYFGLARNRHAPEILAIFSILRAHVRSFFTAHGGFVTPINCRHYAGKLIFDGFREEGIP